MYGFPPPQREKEERENIKGRRAAVRWAVETDNTDIHAVKWEQLIDRSCFSRITSPQSEPPLWSTSREQTCLDTSTPPPSVALSLSDRPYEPLRSVPFSFLLPSPLPSLPRAKPQPASNLTPGFQSLLSWASYRINPLLVLIDVRVTSSPRDRPGHNVWSTSQPLFKREQDERYCTRVTNTPTIIFMVTVIGKHKYCFPRQCATPRLEGRILHSLAKPTLTTLHKLTHRSLMELMIYSWKYVTHQVRMAFLSRLDLVPSSSSWECLKFYADHDLSHLSQNSIWYLMFLSYPNEILTLYKRVCLGKQHERRF